MVRFLVRLAVAYVLEQRFGKVYKAIVFVEHVPRSGDKAGCYRLGVERTYRQLGIRR